MTNHVHQPAPLPGEHALISSLRGEVIRPEDDAYDEARTVLNGMIDRHPALIVRPADVDDVVTAVNFARENHVLLSVRAGGHNVAGRAVNDGGIVIDLRSMTQVTLDPDKRIARVQGGATWNDVDRETQRFGLVAPGGVVSTTGVGGLTLHGGIGHVRRTFGLSIDNIVSAEIVTADGIVRRASATEEPDLFWAIQGAGSNFGVVTEFEFQLHPLGPEVELTAVFYSLDDAEPVLRRWRDFLADMPPEVNSIAIPWNIPDGEPFPAEVRGTPIVLIAAVYAGAPEEARRLLQPLRELATPVLDISHTDSFVNIQTAFDLLYPTGRHYYWKSLYVDDFSDAAVDAIADISRSRPSQLSDLVIWHFGGAISEVADEATAFGRRSAPYLVNIEASWDNPADDAANIAWTRAGIERLEAFSRGGQYLNFPGLGEEQEAQLRDAYGSNFDRLARIKATYDPGNLFRSNLNIAPAR